MHGKRITALISAIIIALSDMCYAFAADGYYVEQERISVDKDAFVYRAVDKNRADEVFTELSALTDTPGNGDEVLNHIEELYDLSNLADDACSIAILQRDKEYSEENIQIFLEASYNSLEVGKLLCDALELIYNSDYVYILNDMLGENIVKECIENLPQDRFYELKKEEEALVSKYDSIYNDSDACARLYIDLVKIRNEIAAGEGYDNYADFANELIYSRDYTDEQIESFSNSVITHYRPLMIMLARLDEMYKSEPVGIPEERVISITGSVLDDINAELGESYKYMIDNNLYDISYSDKKSQTGGAYTLFFNSIKTPYIFLSPFEKYEKDGVSPLHTLIHESGHFAALLNDPTVSVPLFGFESGAIIDTAEVHSQGLEMLTLPYYGQMYGKDAAGEKFSQLARIIYAVTDGLMYNEFQTKVYEMSNLTVENINAVMQEMVLKYYGFECNAEDAQLLWTMLPHNFHSPMYYISYAVSGATALELFGESIDDYSLAVDKYMRLSAGGVRMPFMQAMELCSMYDILSDDSVRNTVDAICKKYGFLYDDIDYDAWYIEHLFSVSDIFDGRSESKFEPESSITRGEFVELIGKMHEYYTGDMEKYTLTFTDVDPLDESAEYIAWAQEKGIVEGYTDTQFGVNDKITREQLVTVMHRLAQFENKPDAGVSGSVNEFSDYSEISDWAIDSVSWAVGAQIIEGRDNKMIVPKGNTTRAETAKIASCFIHSVY